MFMRALAAYGQRPPSANSVLVLVVIWMLTHASDISITYHR